ncbi:MAG: hypothetical protein LC714_04005 [Actinobacteria bacterium]|nr:hypothetical protein [Actinomycetota bacterium]
MERYDFDVRLTPAAREMLRPGEALVLDWHRMAICCAGAGEMSLYPMNEEKARGRRGLVHLKGEAPIYAARAIFPHLAGREIVLDISTAAPTARAWQERKGLRTAPEPLSRSLEPP